MKLEGGDGQGRDDGVEEVAVVVGDAAGELLPFVCVVWMNGA